MRKRLLSILLLCALLAGSASAAQLPAEDTASPDVLSAGERITGAGIDVSQYQGVIDWDTTAQYIDFAIIRCGRGSDLTAQDDTKWAVNAAACERLGIPYGVYLYSLAQTDEEARSEAAHALRLLDGKHPQLPVYLDLEDSGIRANCTKAEVLRHATIFCETRAIRSACTPTATGGRPHWTTRPMTGGTAGSPSGPPRPATAAATAHGKTATAAASPASRRTWILTCGMARRCARTTRMITGSRSTSR